MALAGAGFVDEAQGLDLVPRQHAEWPGFARGPAGSIARSGNLAAVAAGEGGVHLFDIADFAAPRRVGVALASGHVVDIAFGGGRLAVTVSNRLEFLSGGLELWDVTHPGQPTASGWYPALRARSLASSGKVVFMGVAEGMEIIDPLGATGPTKLGEYKPGGTPSMIVSRGDLTVLSFNGREGGLAREGSGRFDVVDTSDPANPLWLAELRKQEGTVGPLCLVGARLYEADGRLRVYDLSSPASPKLVATSEPYFSAAVALEIEGGRAYIANPDRGLDVLDAGLAGPPRFLGRLDPLGESVGGLDVLVSGTRALLTRGPGGVHVLDVSNPAAMSVLGAVPMGHIRRLAVSGQRAFVADDLAGLRIVDISVPSAPVETARYTNMARAHAVALSGSTLYVSGEWMDRGAFPKTGFHVVDVSDPDTPRTLAMHPSVLFDDLTLVGNRAYASPWAVLDISDRENPRTVGSGAGLGVRGKYVVSGTTLYGLNDVGLVVASIANPASPSISYTYRTTGPNDIGAPSDFAVANDIAFVVGQKGMQSLRLGRTSASSVGDGIGSGGGTRIALEGHLAYVLSRNPGMSGVHVVDVSDPARPLRAGFHPRWIPSDPACSDATPIPPA